MSRNARTGSRSRLPYWWAAIGALTPPLFAAPPHGCGHAHAEHPDQEHGSTPTLPLIASLEGLGSFAAGSSLPGNLLGGSTAGAFVAPEFFSHVCIPESIDPPSGWISADSHTHHEECAQLFPEGRLYFDAESVAEQFMAPRDIQISSPLLWATKNTNNQPFDPAGVTIIDGEGIQTGDAQPVFRREWEGFTNSQGLGVAGQSVYLTGIADAFLRDYLPYGVPGRDRIVQDGVEISGWDASHWGHLGGLNLTAGLGGNLFDRYAELGALTGCAPLFDGDASASPLLAERYPFADMVRHFECAEPSPPPTLTGHKNDGTGNWSVPLFEIFERDPAAITGYMHQLWPIDVVVDDTTHGPGVGWDWFAQLGAQYAAEEIHCFPTDMRAAFPDNFEEYNTMWPLLAGPDVATGHVDYLEAYDLSERGFKPDTEPIRYECPGTGPTIACGEEDHHRTPEDAWFGMYYKLLSVGMRPGISAGTDGTCDTNCVPQTYARLGDVSGLTPTAIYDKYTEALRKGHTTLAKESYQFLDLRIDGVPIGERAELTQAGSVEALVTYELDSDLLDDPLSDLWFFKPDSAHFSIEDRRVDLVLDGAVVASKVLVPSDFVNGVARLVVPKVTVSKSGWLAARTRSTSVHTAATPVIVADEPIANCLEAEYWMIYCDYVQSKIDAYENCQFQIDWQGQPVVVTEMLEQHLGCSQPEIEAHLAQARRVFRSVRDYALGDPLGVCRHGDKLSPSGGEPIALVVGGELSPTPGSEVRLSCINAPPDSTGLLLVGTDAAGPIFGSTQLPFFIPDAGALIVQSSHGGHHEIAQQFANGYPSSGTLYAQYVWANPAGYDSDEPLSWTRAVSLSLDPGSPYASCP